MQRVEKPSPVPRYDLSVALPLAVEERITYAVGHLRAASAGLPDDLAEIIGQAIPEEGATEEDIAALADYLGAPLPEEYAAFLRRHHHLRVEVGKHTLWGIGAQPVWDYLAELTAVAFPGSGPWLQIGDYHRYADGDILLLDCSPMDGGAVYVLLHDYPPMFVRYAPSFSLALWRFAFE